jgi:hypothetical protein
LARNIAIAALVLFQQQAAERPVQFESIGKAAPVASEPKTAVIFFAANLRETEAFRRWLSADHADALNSLDYSTRMAVAVFRGAVEPAATP